MRLSRRQLRRIVKEEKLKLKILSEGYAGAQDAEATLYDVLLPALKAVGITGPDSLRALQDAARLYESQMRALLGTGNPEQY